MDVWPITIEGCIHQVRKDPKRWEIGHCNKSIIPQLLALPLCDRIQSNFDVRVHSLI